MLNSFQQGVVILVCINIIAVLGMSILTGFTRLFSFGNAGFMSIGAYASAIMSVRLGMPFFISMVFGASFAGLIAYLLGSLTIRLKGDYFLITCLGFGESVRVLFNYTKGLTGGASGFSGIPNKTSMVIAVLCAVAAFIIAWTFVHSKYGRNLTAIRENDMAAEAVGIHVFRYKRLAFVFSAVFAGWAGALFAHYMRFITPADFALSKSCELITTTVIGGLGSLTGTVLGSLLVTLLPEMFRGLAEYRMLLYGAAVVLVILLKPDGLYGYREFSLTRILRWFRALPERRKAKHSQGGGGKAL